MTFTQKFLFGLPYYPSPFLKVYLPFMFSTPLAYFGFCAAHTALMNEPFNKWQNQLESVARDQEKQAGRTEANIWYEEQIEKNGVPEAAWIRHFDEKRLAKA